MSRHHAFDHAGRCGREGGSTGTVRSDASSERAVWSLLTVLASTNAALARPRALGADAPTAVDTGAADADDDEQDMRVVPLLKLWPGLGGRGFARRPTAPRRRQGGPAGG